MPDRDVTSEESTPTHGSPHGAHAYEVIRHPDVGRFIARAGYWLTDHEVEYNLLLGIVRRLHESVLDFEPPLFFATIESERGVEGCVVRTPPHKLALTTIPGEAVTGLANLVGSVYAELPAVLGPEPSTLAFAKRWAAMRNVRWIPGMQQRIYRLDSITPLDRPPPGGMRRAEMSDVEFVTDWIRDFSIETRVPTYRAPEMAELLIDHDILVLWHKDGSATAMAGAQEFSDRGARISYVYTPPGHRGRGYATALVHGLSNELLQGGRAYCVLYTDVENPVSNAIYTRIGYASISDVRDYTFASPE